MDTKSALAWVFSVLWLSATLTGIYFIAHNPNIPAYITQVGREWQGLNSLVDPNSPAVIEATEWIVNNGTGNPVTDVYTLIPYRSDYDNYWNTDYWATPEETWKHKSGDCEDQSIFLKSVLVRMLQEGYLDMPEDTNISVETQPGHAYVQAGDMAIGKQLLIQEPQGWDILLQDFNELPSIRTFLLGITYTLLLVYGVSERRTEKQQENDKIQSRGSD
jgi:hypothetical protein